jgi:menaquinone-dependent protoporphyrinogen oxidase
MASKVLVAYATKAGATAEAAEEIGKVLADHGLAVEVRAVDKVKSLTAYDAVVIGTAIRMEKPLPEAVNFGKKFKAELGSRPLACFSLGVWMREDTPEHREMTRCFLKPLLNELPEPVSLGLFGGKLDYSHLSPIWRVLASQDKTGLMQEGDWRDWEAIRAWAGELAGKWHSSTR